LRRGQSSRWSVLTLAANSSQHDSLLTVVRAHDFVASFVDLQWL
jgi:hypothetical protein